LRLKLTVYAVFIPTIIWSNWRDYLRDFAPLLFRSTQS